MDKKPRVDKIKNVGKVAEALIENPNKTDREIEAETWVSKSAVNRAKWELGHSGAKDETIQYIVKSSRDRLKDISKIFDHQIREVKRKVIESDEGDVVIYKEWVTIDNKTLTLLKDVAKDDQARITVLWGGVTDKDWWLISIQDLLLGNQNGIW